MFINVVEKIILLVSYILENYEIVIIKGLFLVVDEIFVLLEDFTKVGGRE